MTPPSYLIPKTEVPVTMGRVVRSLDELVEADMDSNDDMVIRKRRRRRKDAMMKRAVVKQQQKTTCVLQGGHQIPSDRRASDAFVEFRGQKG
jgi:hypothetical protein